MEEILRDLIINSSSTTKGKVLSKPCCYFNLSSSRRNWNYEPSSLYISKLYQKCMKSLKNSYKIHGGFSSYPSPTPNHFQEEAEKKNQRLINKDNNSDSDNKSSTSSSGYLSPEVPLESEEDGEEREIFTSILALDILGNLSSGGYSWDNFETDSDSESESVSELAPEPELDQEEDAERSISSKYSGSNSPLSKSNSSSSSKTDNYFTMDDLYEIVEFITPSSGLTNFSLYKKMTENYTAKQTTSEIPEEEENEEADDDETCSIESIEVLESNNFMITSLAISILLETGNLHPEPAKMVAKILKTDMLRRFEEFFQIQIKLLNSEPEPGPAADQEKAEESDTKYDMDIDPIECCNLMRLLYQLDLSDGTEDIQDFLYEYLEQKLYLSNFISANTPTHGNDSSSMEFSPDAFLYFLTRAVMASKSSKAEEIFRDLLCERVLERLGVGCGFDFNLNTRISKTNHNDNFLSSLYIGNLGERENSNSSSSDDDSLLSKTTQYYNNNHNNNSTRNISSLNLALRILCFNELGLLDTKSVKSSILAGEMRVLLKSQSVLDEGCWPADYICKLNPSTYFGGSQLTNVFVLKVLSVFKK